MYRTRDRSLCESHVSLVSSLPPSVPPVSSSYPPIILASQVIRHKICTLCFKTIRNKFPTLAASISMIVEKRKTKAKAQLRFLVLLVKFLMILSVSIRTPNIVFRSRILGRGQTRAKNATRRSAGGCGERSEKRKDNESTRESLILYLSFRSSSIFLRIFYTHSSTVHVSDSRTILPIFS